MHKLEEYITDLEASRASLKQELAAAHRSIRNWEAKYVAVRAALDPFNYHPESTTSLVDLAGQRWSAAGVYNRLKCAAKDAGWPDGHAWAYFRHLEEHVPANMRRPIPKLAAQPGTVLSAPVRPKSAPAPSEGWLDVPQRTGRLSPPTPRRHTLGRRVFEETGGVEEVRRKEWYLDSTDRPRRADRYKPFAARILREVVA